MGCGVSRLDGNGLVFPAKLRPVFLHRLEEIKMRRHTHPLKDSISTPSKKELLLHADQDHEDDHTSASSKSTPLSPKESVNLIDQDQKRKEEASDKNKQKDDDEKKHGEAVKDGNISRENGEINDQKKSKIINEDVKIKEGYHDHHGIEDTSDTDYHFDEDDDDERMIGHDDDGAFPGSPSFRVYFKDDGGDKHDDIGQKDAIKDKIPTDDNLSSKESSENKKVMKRGKKKRSFRRVLPKGGQAAVKNLFHAASCYTPPPSAHDHAHLLTGKTTA